MDERGARRWVAPLVLVLAVLLVIGAIVVGARMMLGDEDPAEFYEGPEGLSYQWSNTPAPVVLLLRERQVRLSPTGCWTGAPDDGTSATGCSDSAWQPASELEDVGRHKAITFWFGMPDWRFRVELVEPVDDPKASYCWRSAKVATLEDQTFRLEPLGPAGTYRVALNGRGPQGDGSVEFLWTTTADGARAKKQCHR